MTIRNAVSATLSAAVVLLPAATLLPTAGYAERDEIVVSVRRKDENLQDVPLAVSTIGGEELERYGIKNLKDVVKYSPGLEFDEGFGAQDTRVVMRGLSPTRGRSNVALLVDGVDFTGEAVSTAGGGILVNQQLLDLERVEVVKGPQSALYGRSAFGGAIQYVTKKPSLEEFESSIGVDLSTNRNFRSDNRNTGRISAAAGGPIAENFGLRVNGLIYDNDGYYNNSVTGQAVGGSEGHGIALTGLWKPSDTLTVSGRIASSSDEYEPRAQARVASNLLVDLNDSVAVVAGIPGPGQTNNLVSRTGPAAFAGGPHPDCATASTEADGTITSCLGTPKVLTAGVMPDADQLRVIQNENPRTGGNYPGTDVDTLTATLQLNWQLSGGEFSSTTGYVDLDSQQLIDGQWDALSAGPHTSLDGTYSFTLAPCGFNNCSPTVQEIDFDNQTKLFSQEFRFSSDLDGPVNYTVGALFWNEEVDQIEKSSSISPSLFRVPAPFPPGLPLPVESAGPGNAILGNVFSPNARKVIRDTESISLYGQVEWDLSDDLTLSFEARWIDEELTVAGDVCDVAATEALTGYPTQTVAGEDFCWQSFRGGSSVAEVLAPGTSLGGPFGPFVGPATLPVGTQTQAATMSRSAKFSDSFVAPKVTLQWDQSDTQMYYASIAQGIKPGGVSTITAGSFFAPDQNLFDKEKLLSFEIGSKSTLMDGDLVLNSALFYQDYTDKQVGVTRFDPVIATDVGSIENAGKSEIYGIEIDAMWQATERLSLSGGYTYVDSEYSEFILETSSANNVARSLAAGGGGCLRLIDNDPGDPADGVRDICVVDLSGNTVEDVPKHSFVGTARYVAPLAETGLEWYADASFIYRDERAMDEFNVKWLDSYWTTDLRGGLVGDNWEVIAYINNLFDDDTVRTGVDVGSQVNTVRQGQWPPGPSDGALVSLPDPRVYGLRVMYEF